MIRQATARNGERWTIPSGRIYFQYQQGSCNPPTGYPRRLSRDGGVFVRPDKGKPRQLMVRTAGAQQTH
jgi:hypothetical protein